MHVARMRSAAASAREREELHARMTNLPVDGVVTSSGCASLNPAVPMPGVFGGIGFNYPAPLENTEAMRYAAGKVMAQPQTQLSTGAGRYDAFQQVTGKQAASEAASAVQVTDAERAYGAIAGSNAMLPIAQSSAATEQVIKLVAQSAASTATVNSAAFATREQAQQKSAQNPLRNTGVPRIAQAAQGASTFGQWSVSLGSAFPQQQILSMEISGWTLPPSQWTIESTQTNLPYTFGYTFAPSRRRLQLTVGGTGGGVGANDTITYTVDMMFQRIDVATVQRVDDPATGIPTGAIRFYPPATADGSPSVGACPRTVIEQFQAWGASYTIQGLRGWPQGVYVIDPTRVNNNDEDATYVEITDPTLVQNIEDLGLWMVLSDGVTYVMRPRVLGAAVLPQCVMVAPAIPSPFQVADVVQAVTNQILQVSTIEPDLAGVFAFSMRYLETRERYSMSFSVTQNVNNPIAQARPVPGVPTPLSQITGDTMLSTFGFNVPSRPDASVGAVAQGGAVTIVAQRQRVHPPQAFGRIRPGLYKTGEELARGVTNAMDGAWFGPVGYSPDDGNAPPFTIVFRQSLGFNLYVRVKSGRYTPQVLASAVEEAIAVTFSCQFEFETLDCDPGIKVNAVVIENNYFVGLAFTSQKNVAFEMLFDDVDTTIDPESLGYRRRQYRGSTVYCPDACGSLGPSLLDAALVDGTNAGFLQLQQSGENPIAQEFLNGRRIPAFPLGNGTPQLAPLRLQALYDSGRRHLSIESIALPAMHSCMVLCENEDAAALLLETPIAHGLAPGSIVSINVSAGGWLTNRATVSPGVALAARDEILKMATELNEAWHQLGDAIELARSMDPEASGANYDGWATLVTAVSEGLASVSAALRWCARVRPYLRARTLPTEVSLCFVPYFLFEGIGPMSVRLANAADLILAAESRFAVFPPFTWNYIESVIKLATLTVDRAMDVTYPPTFPKFGDYKLSMCHNMWVTLQAIYNWSAVVKYARTNAVVLAEPEVFTALPTATTLNAATRSAATTADTTDNTTTAACATTRKSNAVYWKETPYTVGIASAYGSYGALGGATLANDDTCAILDEAFFQSCSSSLDAATQAANAEPVTLSTMRTTQPTQRATRRGIRRRIEQVVSSTANDVGDVPMDEDTGDAWITRARAAQLRKNYVAAEMTVEARRKRRSMLRAARARALFRVGRAEFDRTEAERDATRAARALLQSPTVSELHEEDDSDRGEDTAVDTTIESAAIHEAKQVLNQSGCFACTSAAKWVDDFAKRYGADVGLQAARRIAQRAGTQRILDRLAGSSSAQARAVDCVDPDPQSRAEACTSFDSFVGTTGDALCSGTSTDPLPRAECRLLLLLGQNPASTGSTWPFSDLPYTNTRVVPTANDVYEFNFRDPPPTDNTTGDSPAVSNVVDSSVLGFEPVPYFSFGFRVLSAPNVVSLDGPPFALMDVSVNSSGNYGTVYNFPGDGSTVSPQRVLTMAVLFGSVAAGEVDKRLVIPLDRITKVQTVTIRILRPDGRPMNFHGRNASVLLRLVTIGQRIGNVGMLTA